MICDRVAIIVGGPHPLRGRARSDFLRATSARPSSWPRVPGGARGAARGALRRAPARSRRPRRGARGREARAARSLALRSRRAPSVLLGDAAPRLARADLPVRGRGGPRERRCRRRSRIVARSGRSPPTPCARRCATQALYALLFFAVLMIGSGVVLCDALLRRERAHPAGRRPRGDPALRRRDRDLRRHRPGPPRGRPPHRLHDPLEAALARRVPARQVRRTHAHDLAAARDHGRRLRRASRWRPARRSAPQHLACLLPDRGRARARGRARDALLVASRRRCWRAFFTTGVWVVGHLTRELRDLGARPSAPSLRSGHRRAAAPRAAGSRELQPRRSRPRTACRSAASDVVAAAALRRGLRDAAPAVRGRDLRAPRLPLARAARMLR